MSNEKAKIELLKLGYKPVEESTGSDKIIQETIFKLLELFSEQGHSGFSAPYASAYFKKFAKCKSLDEVKEGFIKTGYNPIEECEDDPDKWIQEGTLELLGEFFKSKQPLDTKSADKIVEYFGKLSLHEPLGPILCTDDEWNDVSEFGGDSETYQNNRYSAVFKEGVDGKPYYIDAIVWKDQNGSTFTGNSILNSKGEKLGSSQTIKLPFEPKTFYIDVIENEDDSRIADESQLDEVWKYYENPFLRAVRKKKLKKLDNE